MFGGGVSEFGVKDAVRDALRKVVAPKRDGSNAWHALGDGVFSQPSGRGTAAGEVEVVNLWHTIVGNESD